MVYLMYTGENTRRRGRFFLACIAMAIAASGLVVAYSFRELLRSQMQLVLLKERCLHWSARADLVGWGWTLKENDPGPKAAAAGWALERTIHDTVYPSAIYEDGDPLAYGATIYLHGRSNCHGTRLVMIHAYQSVDDGSTWLILTVVDPGTPLGKPRAIWTNQAIIKPPSENMNADLHAGQNDPTNASRFTITCGNQGSIIDGELLDDDTVRLLPRTRPPVPTWKVRW